MSSHANVSISLLRRTISYTEKTNTYKNQIILSMLSTSTFVNKKVSYRYVCFWHFLREEKKLGQLFFTIVKLVKSSTKFVLAHFIWTATFAGNHGFRTNISNLGSFYVTPLHDENIFPETREFDGK